MNFTPLARRALKHRVEESAVWAKDAETAQREIFERLLAAGRRTLVGHRYHFDRIKTPEDYRKAVPVHHYEDIRPMVMEMIGGAPDVLWPGKVTRYAQSSGTSDGKSKYIPITKDGLRGNHLQGASDSVAHYLSLYPDSRMFAGKGLILGGSYQTELKSIPRGVRVGDLSANLISSVPKAAELFRVPSRGVALMNDWEVKLPALVHASVGKNVTNLSGVPSWMLAVLKQVLDYTGAKNIHEVWPNLEVFFHGGISFAPYREQYKLITDPTKMRYLETYNASEGFFACQNEIDDPAMLLLLNVGVYYEFIPLDESGEKYPEHAVTAWELEKGKVYEMVITSVNGLWRYSLGDTVRVESVNPPKITIAGRTKHFINAFGEELMVYNADAAISKACDETGAAVLNYTAAPVYADSEHRGRHEWLIEFSRKPEDVEHFADVLDRCLQNENSDYQAKRSHGLFLDRLSIVEAKPGLFDRWLRTTGRLGGQRKIPRLSNDRKLMTTLLELNRE